LAARRWKGKLSGSTFAGRAGGFRIQRKNIPGAAVPGMFFYG